MVSGGSNTCPPSTSQSKAKILDGLKFVGPGKQFMDELSVLSLQFPLELDPQTIHLLGIFKLNNKFKEPLPCCIKGL
jgi:hypothetical protein